MEAKRKRGFMGEDDGFSEALYELSAVGLNGGHLISTVDFRMFWIYTN